MSEIDAEQLDGRMAEARPAHGPVRRMAVFVDETMLTEHGYVPAVAYENEPGYYPLAGNGNFAQPWYWGHDLAAAQKLAAQANAKLGLSEDDVRDILISTHVVDKHS